VEKVDEHCFLFRVELRADPDFLVGVVAGVKRDRLNYFGWLEVAGMPLRVGLPLLFPKQKAVGSTPTWRANYRRFGPAGTLNRLVNFMLRVLVRMD
jgi:hypothetical protein